MASLYRAQQSQANLHIMWEDPKHNCRGAGIKTSAFKRTSRISHCVLQKHDVRFPLNEIKTLQKSLLFLLLLQLKLRYSTAGTFVTAWKSQSVVGFPVQLVELKWKVEQL